MTKHKRALIGLLDELSDKSIDRLYNLAEYLYIHVESQSGEKAENEEERT